MPRVIATTWLDNVSFWHQPLFDLKVGKFSPRQLGVLFVFAVGAFMLARNLAFLGSTIQLILGLAVFVAGNLGFLRRGKTFTPERHLWLALSRGLRRGPRKGRKSWASVPSTPVAKDIELRAVVGKPKQITGILQSSSTGEPLPNVPIEAKADGSPYYSGTTGPDGSFAFFYAPRGPGLHELTIGRVGSRDVMKYQVDASLTETEYHPVPSVGAAPVTPMPVLKREEKKRERYVYELTPVNFATLPPKKQVEAIENFCGFLNSLGSRVRIVAVRSARTIEIKGKKIETEYPRFFVESDASLEYSLELSKFPYRRVRSLPEPKIIRSFPSWVALEGGKIAQTATIYALSPTLLEGFFTQLYDVLERFTVEIRPLPPDVATRRVTFYADRIEGVVQADAQRGRRAPDNIQQLAVRARGLAQDLSAGATRLFEVMVNLTVAGKDKAQLEANRKAVDMMVKSTLMKADWPRWVQPDLLRGRLGKRLSMDTATVGTLFPFASSEVMESPGGVFLGENDLTRGPVLFDPFLRSNQNIMEIGRSGSGKSFDAKIFSHRIAERYPDMAFFVIDPEGEYGRALGGLPETRVVRISRRRPLGLDPLVLFAESKSVAADVIADILSIDPDREPELDAELSVLVDRCGTLQELQRSASRKLKHRLAGLLKGPERFIVTGKPLEFSDRMVFDLSELHRAVQLGRRRVGALHLACLLIFGKIWDYVKRMPTQRPKYILVDEMWLYVALPASAGFLEQVARRGRKSNILCVFATQNPGDVLGSKAGQNTVKNCETKLILTQDETSIARVAKEFGLTEAEQTMVQHFKPGQALLMAEGIRTPVSFLSTPDEYAMFTTRPGEVE